MNADTLTMLCREGDDEANDSFQRQFSHSCNFSKCRLKNFDDSARSFVREIFVLGALVSLRVAGAAFVALSRMYRGWWASFFRPTSGHLESTSMLIMNAQQPSELSVEERNLLSDANHFSSC